VDARRSKPGSRARRCNLRRTRSGRTALTQLFLMIRTDVKSRSSCARRWPLARPAAARVNCQEFSHKSASTGLKGVTDSARTSSSAPWKSKPRSCADVTQGLGTRGVMMIPADCHVAPNDMTAGCSASIASHELRRRLGGAQARRSVSLNGRGRSVSLLPMIDRLDVPGQ